MGCIGVVVSYIMSYHRFIIFGSGYETRGGV